MSAPRVNIKCKSVGNQKALALLKDLQQMNWHRHAPAASARLFMRAITEYDTFPRAEKLRFARIIADWLQLETIGCGFDLQEYSDLVRKSEAAK